MLKNNPLLDTILQSLNDSKAEEILVLDVSQQTTITDVMVICSGRSSKHVHAVAEHLLEHCKAHGWRPIGHQGLLEGLWALVDFGDIVVHIMQPETRAFYALEELWQTPTSC